MPATRQTLLALPFSVPKSDQSEATPQEIQLFVAVDKDPNWTFVSRTSPEGGRFVYRARRDGRYRFLIQAVFPTANGGSVAKVLCRRGVLVDTSPPSVMLKGDRGVGGQVTVSWRAEDPNLAENSINLLYRIGPDGPWQPVAVDRAGVLRNDEGESGRVTWWVAESKAPIDVRGEFLDRARNMAVGHCQLRTEKPKSAAGPLVRPVSTPSLTTQKRPPVLRSLDFELEYDVAGIRPERVREVQLWVTGDNGAHWEHLASDPDCTSPISARVECDGRYGFRIVASGADGEGTFRPNQGTPPELCLEFDGTPPSVRLTSAQCDEEGHLSVTWEAADSRLGARPISVFHGPSPNGPWTELATNRPNTGSATYSLKASDAPVFLRIEAADEAGNIGSHTAEYPVPFETTVPTARIRVVRPRTRAATHGQDSLPRR